MGGPPLIRFGEVSLFIFLTWNNATALVQINLRELRAHTPPKSTTSTRGGGKGPEKGREVVLSFAHGRYSIYTTMHRKGLRRSTRSMSGFCFIVCTLCEVNTCLSPFKLEKGGK